MNEHAAARPLDPAALRRCLGHFVTGVTIVTTLDANGKPCGFTANSFTSVSMTPPLVLVCLANNSTSFASFAACRGFTINILSEEQQLTSARFAQKRDDKFLGVEWRPGLTQAPRLRNSLGMLDCRLREKIPAGDHMILLGEVVGFDAEVRSPLVYAQGRYVSLSVQEAALMQSREGRAAAACIAEREGKILLVRRPGETRWSLPEATLAHDTEGGSSLKETFQKMGVAVEMTFLYSVFETAAPRRLNIVYRGALLGAVVETAEIRLFGAVDLPWDSLSATSDEPMLRRYFREAVLDQFGVYAQIDGLGHVAAMDEAPKRFAQYFASLGEID
jgi:flavin reductase (DIM6/NTAB) family NADH-FMN oxidoreductase RutF